MESQDIKYISMKRTVEANKVKRLQSQLHMIDIANQTKNSHIFFVDNDQEVKKFNLAKHLDTHPLLLDRRVNRPKLSNLDKINIPDVDKKVLAKISESREKAYKELNTRIDRERELSVIQQKLEIKKILKKKSELKPKCIKPGTKFTAPIYEFKYERKK